MWYKSSWYINSNLVLFPELLLLIVESDESATLTYPLQQVSGTETSVIVELSSSPCSFWDQQALLAFHTWGKKESKMLRD